jgi:chemotaxis protein methyltransferase CheR
MLRETVYRDSGIVLDESKAYLLEARLTKVVRNTGLDTLAGLCNLLRATGGGEIRGKLVEAMTTNETLFFRDVKPFETLRVAIPEMLAKKSVPRLRIWSAAASSGQEAYSITMLWRELGIAGADLEIVGTDLSEEVLDRAREGRYTHLEVNRGLPASYLVKYFDRRKTEWEIKPELRKFIRWQRFDLRRDPSGLGYFDFILCRNVLIYFDLETRRKVLANCRRVLSRDGYLVLGSTETTINVDDSFVRREVGPGVVYQQS